MVGLPHRNQYDLTTRTNTKIKPERHHQHPHSNASTELPHELTRRAPRLTRSGASGRDERLPKTRKSTTSDFIIDASSRAMQSASSPAPRPGKLPSRKRGASLGHNQNGNHLRRLQGPRQSRANPYEISPDKPIVTFTIPQDQLPEISPLRKDRKRVPNGEPTMQRSSASTRLAEKRKSRDALVVQAEEADVQPTPRRSPRKHATGDDLPTASPAEKRTSSGRPYKQPFIEDDDNDENEDEIDVVSGELHEVPAPEDDEVQAASNADKSPAKRGPGRPRKSKSGGPGRPRKHPAIDMDSAPQSNSPNGDLDGRSVATKSMSKAVKNLANLKVKPRPDSVRTSRMHLSDGNGRDQLEDTLRDVAEPATTHEGRPRKRKENPRREERAGRPAKKAKSQSPLVDREDEHLDRSETSEVQGDEVSDDSEVNIDTRRLFGQGWKLEQVFSSLSNVGLSSRNGERSRSSIDRDDADVREIHRLCKKAIAGLKRRLEDDPETAASLPDPPREFAAIQRRIRGLCGDNVDFPTNFNDDDKASEIYFHVIPDLVRLLKQTIETYEVIDANDIATSPHSITPDHLRNVKDLVALILEIGRAAVERYKKPASDLVIVKPVKHDILAPLKKVNAALSRSLWSIEEAQIAARRRARLEAEMAEQRLAEEAEEEQRERENRIRKAWLQLHLERRNVEGIVPLKKSKHLHMPGRPKHGVELDQNGQFFERVEVFARRIGPDPTHVAEARRQVWSLREISALQSGLQEFAGPNVFRDIFRKYCRPKGDLNKYNVTEIVTITADLKEHLAETQEKYKGEVDEWVHKIPVWTNIHAMLGQENEV